MDKWSAKYIWSRTSSARVELHKARKKALDCSDRQMFDRLDQICEQVALITRELWNETGYTEEDEREDDGMEGDAPQGYD